MAWRVEWEDEAVKELKKIDARAQRNIVRFLREKIATEDDPRRFGDPLRRTSRVSGNTGSVITE